MNIDKWDIEILVDACSGNPKGQKKLIIPSFQRRREWKSIQEDELIDTLKTNNMSIGALQLYKLDYQGKMENYLLVDGLHRVSTLTKYFRDPFCFNRTKHIIIDSVNKIINKYEKSYKKDDLKVMCDKWFNADVLESYQEFVVDKTYNDKTDILDKIVSKIADKKDKDDLIKMIKVETKNVRDQLEISKSIIPVFMNVGGIETLPLLFKRINQNGTPLTSYDILAAKWYNTDRIEITNQEIIECIESYYRDMQKENNNMEIYNSNNDNKFTVYEYVVGLRLYLLHKFENTFFEFNNDKDFMFKLLACCFYNNISKKCIDKISSAISTENLPIFEKKLEWAVEFISTVLDPVIIYKHIDGEKLLMKDIPLIICMIAIAYKNKSKIENNKDHYVKLFQINMLIDKLSETSFNTIFIQNTIKNSKYLNKIDEDIFSSNYDNFVLKCNKLRKKQDKLHPVTHLILSFMKNFNNNYNCDYEIGTVVSKKKLNEFNKENKNNTIPVNTLGNMCIYQVFDESRKPSMAVVEYLNKNNVSDDDIYKKILYIGENIDYDDIIQQQEVTEKYYMKFVKYRTNQIKELLLNEYNNCINNNQELNDQSESESEDDNDPNEVPIKIKINNKSRNRN